MKALVQAVYTGNIKTCTPTYEGKKIKIFIHWTNKKGHLWR
jgi:hypothetical protein